MPSGIRELTVPDIPACLDLAVSRGWPAEKERWQLLLDLGRGYGWEGPDGALRAAVVLTGFGRAAAVVGMMLVDPGWSGRGIGRSLMDHVLRQTRDHERVFLFSTPEGRPLYDRLGFRHLHDFSSHVGRFVPQPDTPEIPTSRLDPGDTDAVEQIVALDAAVVGLPRGPLVRRLPRFCEQVRVTREDGRITGYAAAWQHADLTAVGPVVAGDRTSARALITDLAIASTRPVRLECPPAQEEDWPAWATAHGLAEVRRTAFMVRGPALPDHAGRYVAPFMQSLG